MKYASKICYLNFIIAMESMDEAFDTNIMDQDEDSMRNIKVIVELCYSTLEMAVALNS